MSAVFSAAEVSHRTLDDAPPPRWRLHWLFAAPHRLAFACGAFMFALAATWWAAALLAQSQGLAWRWGLPPSIAHGLLMGFGFMPMFFAGFLFTAGPKWLGQPPVAARSLVGALLAQLAGWGVFTLGVHARAPEMAAVYGSFGLAAVTAGWALMLLRFARLVLTSRVPDRVHAAIVAGAGAFGVLVLAASALGVWRGDHALVRAALHAGLWAFVGTVYVSVTHRMIPFFTASALPLLDAWRPLWLLAVFVATMVFEAAWALADAWWWPQPAAVFALRAAVEAPVAALLLWLAWRWGLVQSMKIRLLAMLHVGFFWLGIALALQSVSHALMAASDGQLSLGLAPLHAYTVGFLGSTLVAMATRVASGHGGRPLAADDFVWRLFWLLQAAVLLRVVASLAPDLARWATPLAGLGFAVVALAWALRYGRWFGTPRADGRPG